MKDTTLASVIVFLFIGFVLGAVTVNFAGLRDKEKEAVNVGAAYYHPINKEFTWIAVSPFPTNLPAAK